MGMNKYTTIAYGIVISDVTDSFLHDDCDIEGVEIINSGEFDTGELFIYCNALNVTDEGGANIVGIKTNIEKQEEFNKVAQAYKDLTGRTAKIEDFKLTAMNSYW